MSKQCLKFDKQSKLSCPNCGCLEFYEMCDGGGSMIAVCANCRSLVRNSPFPEKDGRKTSIIEDDASKRFPEILQWWDKRFDYEKAGI